MSGAPSTANDPVFAPDGFDAQALRTTALQMVAWPVRFVAFWAAVALPFLYFPLLHGGLQDNQTTIFVGLLALNFVAVLLGHDYRRG